MPENQCGPDCKKYSLFREFPVPVGNCSEIGRVHQYDRCPTGHYEPAQTQPSCTDQPGHGVAMFGPCHCAPVQRRPKCTEDQDHGTFVIEII